MLDTLKALYQDSERSANSLREEKSREVHET
jgi:hypothetical protein